MTGAVHDNYVYLDWAATSPLFPEARFAMDPYVQAQTENPACFANPNSLHTPGRRAFAALEQARKTIAEALGASRPSEIVFTSGATEADNMAVIGIARAAAEKRRAREGAAFKPRVIVSAIEHDAVLKPAQALAHEGFDAVKIVPDKRGFITPELLSRVLDEKTVLVSIQMANSEIGSIQPISALAACAHEMGALFHTDAVQALGKTAVHVRELGVDAASFSAHKIGGPKGIGALYLKAQTPLSALMLGGGQEDARRSGTQNVCGAAGFAAAVEVAVRSCEQEQKRLMDLRDELYRLVADMPGVNPTMDVAPGDTAYLPNIVHLISDSLESETMVLRLDHAGFAVSGGSACASHSLEPSHVLKALGIDPDRAYRSLRISMGRYTEREDIEAFAESLQQCHMERS